MLDQEELVKMRQEQEENWLKERREERASVVLDSAHEATAVYTRNDFMDDLGQVSRRRDQPGQEES